MKLCRHRHRDDRHRVAVPIQRINDPTDDGNFQLQHNLSHGVGVLKIAKIVCLRVPTSRDTAEKV